MWNYEQRLICLSAIKNSTLLSFKRFIEFGTSSLESVTLKKILRSINKFMKNLLGIHTSFNAWNRYTSSSEDFDSIQFLPDLFLEPQHDQLYFIEEMVKTQLFASFVQEKN